MSDPQSKMTPKDFKRLRDLHQGSPLTHAIVVWFHLWIVMMLVVEYFMDALQNHANGMDVNLGKFAIVLIIAGLCAAVLCVLVYLASKRRKDAASEALRDFFNDESATTDLKMAVRNSEYQTVLVD